MPIRETQPRTRYSCQEAREDSELVLSDRATGDVRERYEEHLRACRDCRRVHRALYAVYEGPAVPAAAAGVREEKEFHAILRRMKTERAEPWYRKWMIGATVGGLATAAAVLTLTLFDIAPEVLSLPQHDDAAPPQLAGAFGGSGADETMRGELDGGIEHPAQSYGRVVGGLALIVPPGEQAASSDTFPVGTKFAVDPDQSLQVGLVGKIVANFTPSSEVEWTAASPSLLELRIERGIAAVRYDRRPSDPVLQIRTPTAVVRVIGTVFTVQVDERANTIVSVLRGQVEVLHPETNRLLAEVESGFRYDVAKSTFDDPGKTEVEAALPLSNDHGKEDPVGAELLALADGRIPTAWNVPGLPEDPRFRTLDYVPARASGTTPSGASPRAARPEPTVVVGTREPSRQVDDEGDELIARLVRDAELTRRKELRGALSQCRELYESVETRYLAAKCLSTFIEKYGDDPLAVEGYLLVGILRMDYALDYDAAEVAFQTFLRRAPNHASAEVALYRMWLASTENGRISEALDRGRKYLSRYPHGKFVGKILQRFPELKSAL